MSQVTAFEDDPQQWSKWRRWTIVFVVWSLVAALNLSITSYSGVQQQIQEDFQTTHFVITLGVGLFNFGSIFGPMICGPLSEMYGRRPIYIGSSVGFVVCSVAVALSPTIVTLLTFRGLAGLIGSAVLSLYGGTIADLCHPHERGTVVALFTIVLVGALLIGPVPSSILGTVVHWRWLMGAIAAGSALVTALVICLPETEVNTIRRRRAKEQGLRASEDLHPAQSWAIWRTALLAPVIMLFSEPIVTWTTLYHSFVYGLLYLLIEAYPYVYKSQYGMSRQQSSLVLITPFLGNLLGVFIYMRILRPRYEARRQAMFAQFGDKKDIPPEAHLPAISFAAFLTSIGMFWFAFSADPDTDWIFPVLSGLPVGVGMTLLYLSMINYYIDLYPTQSASVVAANCAIRRLASSVFPSLGVPLYAHLGARNASLLLACISCLGIPSAFILHRNGKHLRAASRRAKQDVDGNSDFNGAAPLMGQHPQPTYGGTSASS